MEIKCPRCGQVLKQGPTVFPFGSRIVGANSVFRCPGCGHVFSVEGAGSGGRRGWTIVAIVAGTALLLSLLAYATFGL
ncbi:MAG: hypothetical protein ABI333_03480 [bacterium]